MHQRRRAVAFGGVRAGDRNGGRHRQCP
jgi:hypothetical protein